MPNKSKECWKRRITLIESFDLEQLRKVVTQCGQAILDFERTDIVVLSNDDENKKTNLDVLINESMTHGLKMILDIPIISEEDDDRTVKERPRTYWLVDPIDGTRSYLDGFNTYVTQAALILDSQPVIAVVYAPALDELFTAVKGEGAFKNNRRIQVSSNLVPEIIIDNYPSPNDFLRGVMENLSIKEYIECGSIALKICRVSEGAADVFVRVFGFVGRESTGVGEPVDRAGGRGGGGAGETGAGDGGGGGVHQPGSGFVRARGGAAVGEDVGGGRAGVADVQGCGNPRAG